MQQISQTPLEKELELKLDIFGFPFEKRIYIHTLAMDLFLSDIITMQNQKNNHCDYRPSNIFVHEPFSEKQGVNLVERRSKINQVGDYLIYSIFPLDEDYKQFKPLTREEDFIKLSNELILSNRYDLEMLSIVSTKQLNQDNDIIGLTIPKDGKVSSYLDPNHHLEYFSDLLGKHLDPQILAIRIATFLKNH